MRTAFAEGLGPLLDTLTEAVAGHTPAERRRKAIATMSELVGAIILSRAVGDAALSDEILEATRQELVAAPPLPETPTSATPKPEVRQGATQWPSWPGSQPKR